MLLIESGIRLGFWGQDGEQTEIRVGQAQVSSPKSIVNTKVASVEQFSLLWLLFKGLIQ